MGYKDAKVAEAKPSQNFPLNSKTALKPYKIQQQLAKSMSNNVKNKQSNK